MYIDLTTHVSQDCLAMQWANIQENAYIAMGHVGTHLDTYEKSEIPLEYFKSQAIVFDVRNKPEVSCDDIDLALIEQGDFVLFRTGQMETYGYENDAYVKNHPQLSHDLIHTLMDKKIRFIGVDCPGIRQNKEHEPADCFCEQHGTYVIENLSNLSSITTQRFTMYTMWLYDEKMTGLRCKVIAECAEK